MAEILARADISNRIIGGKYLNGYVVDMRDFFPFSTEVIREIKGTHLHYDEENNRLIGLMYVAGVLPILEELKIGKRIDKGNRVYETEMVVDFYPVYPTILTSHEEAESEPLDINVVAGKGNVTLFTSKKAVAA